MHTYIWFNFLCVIAMFIEDFYFYICFLFTMSIFAARQLKLVTLHQHVSVSCLVNQELLSTRDSATKTVLKAAKVVMGLSSYVGM